MGIVDSILRLTGHQKRKMARLYDVMAKCPLWKKYGCCKNMDGRTCVQFRQCGVLKAYDKEFVRLAEKGEKLPYLPGNIDYSGMDRHPLMGKKPRFVG